MHQQLARALEAQAPVELARALAEMALEQALDAAEKKFGAVDILINNAGVIAKGSILDLDPDEFDRVLRVNLRSYFILTQMA
ncbi:MAG: SDR family NAD(P)-dependent oxidoreductase, partial [Pseudomonadota bacterium]